MTFLALALVLAFSASAAASEKAALLAEMAERALLERQILRHLQRGSDGGAAARALQGGNPAPATGMCGSATSCTSDGSAAYTTRALTHDALTGKFSGTLTFNQCPHLALENTYKGVLRTANLGAANCVRQTYPQITTLPAAAPLRGAVGYTIRGGMNVYGPMDAGFFPGSGGPNICSAPATSEGICPRGTDVEMCFAHLQYRCGSANAAVTGFASDCGNHASPSHYHTLISCDYNASDASAHSSLLAVIKDGRGLYGRFEGGGQRPSDLDACNGHWGTVPPVTLPTSATEYGNTAYAGATNVYHYHVTDTAPFTIGCYGPVASLAAAKALYPECGTACAGCGTVTDASSFTSPLAGSVYSACTSLGAVDYTLDCPVFRHVNADGSVSTANQIAPTVRCPGCVGCSYPPASPTSEATPSPSLTQSPSLTPSTTASPSRAAAAATPAATAASPSQTATMSSSSSATQSPSATGKGASAAPASASAPASAALTSSSTRALAPSPSATATRGSADVAGALLFRAVNASGAAALAAAPLRAILESALAKALAAQVGLSGGSAALVAARAVRIADATTGAAVARALQAAVAVQIDYAATVPSTLAAAAAAAIAEGGPAAFPAAVLASARAGTAASGLADAFALATAAQVVPYAASAPPPAAPPASAASGSASGAAIGGAIGGVLAVALLALAVVYRHQIAAATGCGGKSKAALSSTPPKALQSGTSIMNPSFRSRTSV